MFFAWGQKRSRKAPPMRRAPVPEMDCVIAMFSRMGEFAPYARVAAALVNDGIPVIPAYSLSSALSRRRFSAVRTEGRT